MTGELSRPVRGREFLSIGVAVGMVAACVSAAVLLTGPLEPPRWSTLPWGLLPDALLLALHRAGPALAWILGGVLWATAATVAWAWHRRRAEFPRDRLPRLLFDALTLLVPGLLLVFVNDALGHAPRILRFEGNTPLSGGRWGIYSAAIVVGVLGSVLAWRALRRVTPHPGSAAVAFALACTVPSNFLKLLDRAHVQVFFFEHPLQVGMVLSVTAASFFLLAFLFLARLSGVLSRRVPTYDRLCMRLARRRLPLFLAALLVALGLVGVMVRTPWGARGGTPRADSPNVVLIVVDTLRADHLGAYGYAKETSPHLDAWAEGGVIFEQAYSVSSFTNPGTAGILTSRFPSELGVSSNNTRLPAEVPTLAEFLSEQGYVTAAFVGNYVLRRAVAFFRGFDLYDDWFPGEEAVRGLPERGAGPLTDAAIAWLDHRPVGKPFFLWVHYQDPHGPYLPPPDFAERFAVEEYQAREVPPAKIPRYQRLEGFADARSFLAGYDNEIAYWDHHFGRLLARLDAGDETRSTLVVFTADHGETLDEPANKNFAHGTNLSEAQVQVPLIFGGSGIVRARRVPGPVSSLDIVPTVLALVGTPQAIELELRGENLAPLLTGRGEADPGRTVISELPLRSFLVAARGPGGAASVRRRAAGTWSAATLSDPRDAAAGELEAALAAHQTFIDRRGRKGTEVQLTAAEAERLRALGYLP